MEFGLFIVEIIIGLLDVLTISSDIHAWFKGRENRIERRMARQAGRTPPPRDRWNRSVIALSVIAALLTTVLLARLLR